MLKYLVLSDIHLGHNINKTSYIVNNLLDFFITYKKELSKLNIIFIAGDTFDRLLTTNSKDYLIAVDWLTYLVKYCQEHDIILRILEGTPSHDWKQVAILDTVISKLNLQIDFKYISTLAIDHIPKYNINILYVPDEYKPTAEETFKDVQDLLNKNHLQQVDIAIMHGQFTYQLPIKLESSHIEENYLNIVKYYINIGHIHTHSVRDRILAQGSFDRLTHGQEEDKGAILVTIDKDISYKFLVNKKAMRFVTLTFKANVTIEDITKKLSKIEPNTNVRLILDSKDMLDTLKKNFPLLNIKIESKKKEDIYKLELLDTSKIEKGFSITPENIEELLTKEMVRFNLPKDLYTIYLEKVKAL